MIIRNINQHAPAVQYKEFCKEIGLARDDHGINIAKQYIKECGGKADTAILRYKNYMERERAGDPNTAYSEISEMFHAGTPCPALYRVGPNDEKIFLTDLQENVPVQLGASPKVGITVEHEKDTNGKPIGMAKVAATIKYIRVGNNGDFLLEVSGSNVESSDGTASLFLFDSWMKGWDDPGERVPVPSTRLLDQYNDTKYFLSEGSQFVSRSRGNDSLDIIGVYIPSSALQVINEPEEMDLDTAKSAGEGGGGSNNNMMEDNISHEFSQLSTEKTVHGNEEEEEEEEEIRRLLRDLKNQHNQKRGTNHSTQEFVDKAFPERDAQNNQQDSIPDDYTVPMPFLQESAKDDPVKLLFQHTRNMPDILELALDTDIYKVLESGTLSQCLAKLLSLRKFKRCGMHLRRLWREGEAPYQAMRLFLDAEENGLELGYEGDPDDAPDDERSFFQHSGDNPTPSTIQKWLVTLAPCYIKEFSHHFGDSVNAVQAELDKFAATPEHFSPLMIAVASRFLRAHIILFLPGASEPLLLLPYPIQDGEHSSQWGDHSNHIVRLQLSADGTLSLVVHKYFDDDLGFDDDADDDEVAYERVYTKSIEKNVLKTGTKKIMDICRFYLNSERGNDDELLMSRKRFDQAKANKIVADRIIDEQFSKEGGPYKKEDIEQTLRSNGCFSAKDHLPIHSDAHKLQNSSKIGKLCPDYYNNPELETLNSTQKSWPSELVTKFRHDSAEAIREKTKDNPEWCGVFEHRLDYPIDDVIGTIGVHNAGPMLPGQGELHIFDPNILESIPKEYGPRKGMEKVKKKRKKKSSTAPTKGRVFKSRSGVEFIVDQISGKEWMEQERKVPSRAKMIDGYAFRYCLLPAWMQPHFCQDAVSVHIDPIDKFGQWAYLGSSSVGAFYFHRHKMERAQYYRERAHHSVAYFPMEHAKVHHERAGFVSLGDQNNGCDQLTKTKFPIPYSSLFEVHADDIYFLEKGATYTKVFQDGDFCKPTSLSLGS